MEKSTSKVFTFNIYAPNLKALGLIVRSLQNFENKNGYKIVKSYDGGRVLFAIPGRKNVTHSVNKPAIPAT